MEGKTLPSPPVGLLTPVEWLRRQRGWSAKELAERASTSGATISRVEAGMRPASPELRERIAEALDTDEEELWPLNQAAALAELWRHLVDRLGTDFFRGAGDVDFVVTPKGRLCIAVGEITYFEAEGAIVASRMRRGFIEYALVTGDGELNWGAPVQPAMN